MSNETTRYYDYNDPSDDEDEEDEEDEEDSRFWDWNRETGRLAAR